jgi:TolB protein
MNADGTALTPLTSGSSATDPSLSHDGTRLLYVLDNGIWLRDLGAPAPTQHSEGSGDVSPAWAWDDRQIAFAGIRSGDQGSNDDREIRLDTLDPANASVALTRNATEDHDPVFTPDGKYLFWVRGAGDNRELWRVDLATEAKLQVTDDAFNDVDPAISPDGTKLVFVSNRESSNGQFDLWMLDPRNVSLPPTRVAAIPGNQHDPEWSPGGRYIIFHGDFDGSQDLFILDIEGNGEPLRITSTGDNDQWPSWAPIP